MRPLPSCLAFALSLTAATASAQDRAADERALLEAERAICDAYQREDATWLERHLDREFTLTSSNGSVSTRADEVAELRAGKIQYDVFRNRDSKVRFDGDAAVVNGITMVQGTASGEAFKGDFQFTDVYVRRGKEWVIVASHASRLPNARAEP